MGSSLFQGSPAKSTSLSNTNSTNNSDTNLDTKNTSTSDPTAWQMPYLATGFNGADKAFRDASSSAPQQAYSPLNAWGDVNSSSDFSRSSIPYSSDMMSSGRGLYQSSYPAAGGALNSAVSRASSDPTGSNIASAGAYANNPYTQGMITSAQTPIQRQLDEVSIPKLNVSANGTNNTDSSRAGVTEGVLRRSAGIDEANAASDILGKNWSSGLSTAENARTANNTALLQAGSGLSTLGNNGADLVAGGNKMGMANAAVPITNAQTIQTDANASNKTDYANAFNNSQWPWLNLNNYWGVVGKPLGTNSTNNTNGTTSTNGSSTGLTNTTGTQTPAGMSPMAAALGLATGVGSFFAPGLGGAGSIASGIGSMFKSNPTGTNGLY